MKTAFRLLILIVAAAIGIMVVSGPTAAQSKGSTLMDKKPEFYPTAIFAGGCFWCTESEYRAVPGVLFTRVGYIGGHIDNPKYEDTHNSKSGHAESVEVTYDPEKLTYHDLVEFFMTRAHDPAQLNRQGPDVGTEYRSAIFYHNENEKKIAQAVIDELTAKKEYDKPIVTTLEPATKFWEAEDYHQQFYEKYEKKTGQPHIKDWLGRQKRGATQ
ncbi:MAG: peptide-methionine (S)-S-oxide reductase MsrA [Alphaproteobacteria bacterium]